MKIAIVITIIVAAIVWSIYTGDVPKKYRVRNCTGTKWKRNFPESSKEEIRAFLFLFTDAFAFSRKQKLKFEPDDKVMDIYKALYPAKWMTDSLEVETLSEDIERKYGIKFNSIWHNELTLGELYAKVNSA